MMTQPTKAAAKPGCSEPIYEPGGFADYHYCTRKGILFEEGKHWCRQHAPSTRKAKRVAWEARWARERAEQIDQKIRREAKEAAYAACQAAGLSTEALQDGVIEDLIAALRALAERMQLHLGPASECAGDADRYAWQAATIVLRNARGEGVQP